jgi:serine/threonine-protein kinase
MAGKIYDFSSPDAFIFGRSDKAHCQILTDPVVSRLHFMIEFDPPAARLKDLGSTNGVSVNGVKYGGRTGDAPKAVDLRDGDRIRVGGSIIVFRVKGDAGLALESPPGGGFSLAAMVNAMENRVGSGPPVIPGYDGLSKVNAGSAGVVYKARRLEDDRQVAIKVMKIAAGRAQDAMWIRFSREIEITRFIRHPNVVEFLDAGRIENGLYLAMEYMAGGDLSERLEKYPRGLPVGDAIAVMRQILDGMAAVHKEGVVHRDLKPGNILFADETMVTAKISDLGMAKNLQESSCLTLTGGGGGTPAFMPPEQITQFRHAQPTADVFSLAAMFYQLLTRETAYNFTDGKDYLSTIIDGDIVPLGKRRTFLGKPPPGPLAELIMRGLSPEPADRFPDAGAMLAALDALGPL